MECKHGVRPGTCENCRMEALERYHGVPEDHIEEVADQ